MLRFLVLLGFTSLFLSPSAGSQTKEPIKPAKAKADYSQEAFVIEQFSSKNQFENDGTSTEENTARYRIQSEAGAQRYGVLSFSYASGTGNFELVYVRVRKPDGSVVVTPPENVQDMAANITREAPFYSDIHEKHVAVKGLSVGDELEYQVREHTTKPLAPGQFWTAYSFAREQITLDEQLEIRVPRGRVVKVKSNTIQPIITDVGEYRTYTWHNANLESKDQSADKRLAIGRAWQLARGRLPHPDVMISSFLSWDEVGRWYGRLQEERVKPTPDVTAKAGELTNHALTDDARMRALYQYVSTQFRYIGIALGIGRYQPHSAAEVMANQYGDCKDKHTLLASLMSAAGIPAYPALISTTNEVDADVPSPGQFNHVITVVPRANGLVWLDSTAEVGPYEYLISPLRDKHALAIWKDKPATLESTPVDLKNGTLQTFNITAKLSDDGTLVGQADMSARGDQEYLLRAGFRSVPLPQWKDLVQQISQNLGFGGEVSEVTASSPEKTEESFHFDYTYTRKKFGDWDSKRIVTPMPFITLPVPSDDEFLPLGPMYLGSLSEVKFDSQVELPKGYRPELPEAVHLKRDFAQFDVTYEFKDGKLFGEQHLKTLMREVPASEREQLKEFVKAVQDNYGRFIQLTTGSGTSETSIRYPSAQSMSSLRNLPESQNREAVQLEQEAREDMSKHDMQAATTSLYRAVAADPKFTRAWITLGVLLLTQRQVEAGIDAFHKAIASDPEKPAILKVLGMSLAEAGQFEDAVKVWRDYSKANPEDLDGFAALGGSLIALKRYPDAVTAFEAGVKLDLTRVDMQERLGRVYLLAGDRDKAAATYRKIGDLNPDRDRLNSVAYELAKADLELPKALEYSKRAVREVEDDSQKITLPELKIEDLRKIWSLAAYWDTQGWVDSRMANFDEALEYLRAAWMLTQDGIVAKHLCAVYQRMHKIDDAIQMCEIAVNRIPQSEGVSMDEATKELDDAQKELERLKAKPAKAKVATAPDATDVVIKQRSFKMPRFLQGSESAEFFVLLSSDGKSKTFKVEDVKFISGSEKMKPQGKQLKTITFNFPAPSGAITRFVRRGILGCYESSGCSFVLLDAATVKSLD